MTCSAPLRSRGFQCFASDADAQNFQMIKAIVLPALVLVAVFAVPILEADDADTTFTVTDDDPVLPSEFG